MSQSDKTLKTILTVLALVATARLLGHVSTLDISPLAARSAGLVRTAIHFLLIVVWSYSIRRRITQKQVRSQLLFISGLMCYWLAARTLRYYFVIRNLAFYRLLWYSYYIPILLIPHISVLMALYMGRRDEDRLPRWTSLFYIPTFLLIALVLTNDFHQKVFTLVSYSSWARLAFRYEMGYRIIFAYALLCALGALAILIAKGRRARSRRILWLPLLPVLATTLYGLLYAVRFPLIHRLAGDLTVTFCLLLSLVFESCIQVGLIRSNSN